MWWCRYDSQYVNKCWRLVLMCFCFRFALSDLLQTVNSQWTLKMKINCLKVLCISSNWNGSHYHSDFFIEFSVWVFSEKMNSETQVRLRCSTRPQMCCIGVVLNYSPIRLLDLQPCLFTVFMGIMSFYQIMCDGLHYYFVAFGCLFIRCNACCTLKNGCLWDWFAAIGPDISFFLQWLMLPFLNSL